MKDAIIEVIKWVRESVRPVFMFFVVSALLFFLPRTWAAAIGITEGFQKYHFAAFLLFAGSFVWLISFPIEQVYRKREKKKRLDNLPTDEREILRCFVAANRTTQEFGESWIPATFLLVKDGILHVSSSRTGRRAYHFSMELWILQYLRKNPNLTVVQVGATNQ